MTDQLREALAEWDAIEGSDLSAQFRAFMAAGKMADAIRAALDATPPAVDGYKRVLMTDELFEQLGASKVEWGEPDGDGFYTPSVYAAPPAVDVEGLLAELAESPLPGARYAYTVVKRRLGDTR